MKLSRRASRMQRNHKRNSKGSGLNLTALMDIFTILVFFLMVNQSDGVAPSSDSIELPVSIAQTSPTENVLVMLSKDAILVQGRLIVATAQIAKEGEEIAELKAELDYLFKRMPMTAQTAENGQPITIMGDKHIAYDLLKRVMATCAKAGFNNISLAVNQKQEGGAK